MVVHFSKSLALEVTMVRLCHQDVLMDFIVRAFTPREFTVTALSMILNLSD